MGKIVILEKSVADKIAAGEVVERPASVVKELVENSLDAGASSLVVNLEGGGHELIEIIDDGSGMSREDARTAIQRFATSKISRWEDLEEIHTFGFRGEALPSVAAVSKMEIHTREADVKTGTLLSVEGGEILDIRETGTPEGTRIRVMDLFFNTPARRKFLKSASAETAHIVGVVQKLSLVNDMVSFKLSSNGREIFHFPAAMSTRERVTKIWGLPLNSEIVPIEYETSMVRVSGFVCKPDVLKSHRSNQLIFVNGRFIKNAMVSQAIAEGFEPLLPAGKYPLALLFIDLRGTDVDVNVHPNKTEVRFVHSSGVFKAVRDAIKMHLRGFGFSPILPAADSMNPNTAGGFSGNSLIDTLHAVTSGNLTYSYPREIIDQASSLRFSGSPKELLTEKRSGQGGESEARRREPGVSGRGYEDLPLKYHPESPWSPSSVPQVVFPIKPAGGVQVFNAVIQLKKTYIIGTVGDELWIVDQHTAHERINYEKLYQRTTDSISSQQLLFPVMLEVPVTLYNFVMDKIQEFENLGFEIEPFGGNSILVKAIPLGFEKLQKEEILRDILEEVAGEQLTRNIESFREHTRSTVACKASVKSGDSLTIEEMNSLVNELIHMDYSSFCPHGRPVVVKLSKEHLDRMFHRI